MPTVYSNHDTTPDPHKHTSNFKLIKLKPQLEIDTKYSLDLQAIERLLFAIYISLSYITAQSPPARPPSRNSNVYITLMHWAASVCGKVYYIRSVSR